MQARDYRSQCACGRLDVDSHAHGWLLPAFSVQIGCGGSAAFGSTFFIKPEPMGTYYGRCKFHGKLVRQSLETKDFKVAKTKVRQRLIDVRGRVNAHEGNIESLGEEYQRRLQLLVDIIV